MSEYWKKAFFEFEFRLGQNIEYLEGLLPTWGLRPTDHIKLVQKPTASKLCIMFFIHLLVGDLGTLNDLAQLLDSGENWLDIYNEHIGSNSVILAPMNAFRSLPEETPDIQSYFNGLVSYIAAFLGFAIQYANGRKVIVGGFLAKDEYDVREYPSFL